MFHSHSPHSKLAAVCKMQQKKMSKPHNLPHTQAPGLFIQLYKVANAVLAPDSVMKHGDRMRMISLLGPAKESSKAFRKARKFTV